MRKKILALILSLGICLSFCGCGYQELYERLLIHGIGVDIGDNGFVVTVRSSISTEEEGEEYFKSEGASVLEALNNLSLSTGREPFYAHNYLVVFGRECAEVGLDQCMDFFVRYYNTRPAVQMYLAENTAEEVLSAQKDGKYLKMSEIQQLGDGSRYNGKTVGVEILDFVNGVKREGSSPILPVLKATESGVELSSTAYFDGYRLKGFLTLEETRGYLAVKDKIEKGEAVVSGESFGSVTLSLSSGAAKVQVRMDGGGKPVFRIEIQVEADVSAVSGGRSRLEEDLYGELEREISEDVKGAVSSAVSRTVLEDRCDIFGFGNLLFRKYPDYWRNAADGWKEQMADCRYEVRVSARVLRIEQETLGLAGS